MLPVVKVGSLEELGEALHVANISTGSWGVGKAKTIGHLFDELRAGEARLVRTSEGKLRRETEVVCLEIAKEGRVLKEIYQLFYESGRTRTRTLDTTTGEKMRPGETPLEALRRLVREEFPVLQCQTPDSFEPLEVRTREAESESYPELTTRYVLHFFTVELQLPLPDFVVQEADKMSAYAWVNRPK